MSSTRSARTSEGKLLPADKFFVHEKAICESTQVGEGTRVWGFSHVMKGATLGRNCNVGEHVFIENKVTIGNGCTIKNGVAIWDLVMLEDDVFVGPFATFTNDLKPRAFLKRSSEILVPTIVKRGATIGANATIVCGVTLGEYCFVAAGSVVTKDVPPHTLVAGVPAKPISRVCFCGEALEQDRCPQCKIPLTQNSLEKVLKNIK